MCCEDCVKEKMKFVRSLLELFECETEKKQVKMEETSVMEKQSTEDRMTSCGVEIFQNQQVYINVPVRYANLVLVEVRTLFFSS